MSYWLLIIYNVQCCIQQLAYHQQLCDGYAKCGNLCPACGSRMHHVQPLCKLPLVKFAAGLCVDVIQKLGGHTILPDMQYRIMQHVCNNMVTQDIITQIRYNVVA